jgi:hypothetical protein
MATYVFSTDLYIIADCLAGAEDGLMDLLVELVNNSDSDPFYVKEIIHEEAV